MAMCKLGKEKLFAEKLCADVCTVITLYRLLKVSTGINTLTRPKKTLQLLLLILLFIDKVNFNPEIGLHLTFSCCNSSSTFV